MYCKTTSTFHIQLQQAPAATLVRMVLQTLECLLAAEKGEDYKNNPFTKEVEKNNGASVIKSLKEIYRESKDISDIVDALIRKCQESDIFLAIEFKSWSLAISLSATCNRFLLNKIYTFLIEKY
jgi:hypothetical protein